MSTVYIVDDDAAVRTSLEYLIASVELTAKGFETAADFLRGFNPNDAACILLDVRMPGISGLELQTKLAELNCLAPIVFLTGHADVAMAVRAMKNGAFDFIEKPYNDQVLLDCIHRALAHNSRQRDEESRRSALLERIETLSAREREILGHIAAGLANKEIATQLGLSEKTIEAHRARLYQKLEANNVATLVRIAIAAEQATAKG
ncbi:MAG: response regulator [Phycisphaerae bacterium]